MNKSVVKNIEAKKIITIYCSHSVLIKTWSLNGTVLCLDNGC